MRSEEGGKEGGRRREEGRKEGRKEKDLLMVLGLITASYALYRVLCRSQSAIKMPSKVAAGTLIFT